MDTMMIFLVIDDGVYVRIALNYNNNPLTYVR